MIHSAIHIIGVEQTESYAVLHNSGTREQKSAYGMLQISLDQYMALYGEICCCFSHPLTEKQVVTKIIMDLNCFRYFNIALR